MSDEFAKLLAKRYADAAAIPETISAEIPQLSRGRVWCTACWRSQRVDSAECLRSGWPTCCGYTMTIDSPEERSKR